MAKQVKEHAPVRVLISQVVIDRTQNVREEDSYDVKNLAADIALQGQQVPAMLEKMPDGSYIPLRGFLRATAIKRLAEEGVIDPLTEKPFDSIIAVVKEGLTEHERIQLKLDHAQVRSLNRVELFYAMEHAFQAQYTEKEIVVILRSLLEQHYPPTRKIDPPTDENYLAYYRGVVQTARRAAFAPKVLRDAWVEKTRGNQSWPRKADMETLSKIATKEIEEDKTNQFNRNNPGPKFLSAWAKYLEELTNSPDKAPKPVSMLSRDAVGKLKAVFTSMILKTMMDVILRDKEGMVAAGLDKFLTDIENNLSESKKAELIAIVSAGQPAASA